jgi:hypothetical protein
METRKNTIQMGRGNLMPSVKKADHKQCNNCRGISLLNITYNDNVKKPKRWKPISKKPIVRPKTCWEDDVLEDIKSMKVCDWKNVVQNTDRWKKMVEQARTLCRL